MAPVGGQLFIHSRVLICEQWIRTEVIYVASRDLLNTDQLTNALRVFRSGGRNCQRRLLHLRESKLMNSGLSYWPSCYQYEPQLTSLLLVSWITISLKDCKSIE